MEYHSATKKREILPFVATWMKLEDNTLCEISQTRQDKYYIWNHLQVEWKTKDTNELIYKTDPQTEKTN